MASQTAVVRQGQRRCTARPGAPTRAAAGCMKGATLATATKRAEYTAAAQGERAPASSLVIHRTIRTIFIAVVLERQLARQRRQTAWPDAAAQAAARRYCRRRALKHGARRSARGRAPSGVGGVVPINKASSTPTRQLARSRRRRQKEVETSVSAKGFGHPGSAKQVQERFGNLNCAQRKRERERNGTH